MVDTVMWFFLFGVILIAIVLLVFGIKFFKKYKNSGKKLHLILGILLTFIIPGIVIYLTCNIISRIIAVAYMPPPY